MRTHWRHALAAVLLLGLASPSFADEAEELRKLRDSTIALINALVEQGVLTRAKADAIIAQAEQAGAKPPAAAVPPGAPPGVPAAPPAAAPGAAAAPPVAPGTVRVPYIPETVKQEISSEVKQEVLAQAKTERWGEPGAFPDWLKRFFWYGDLRFRYEQDSFPNDNPPNAPVQTLQFYGVNTQNSTVTNNRWRIRGRFGFDATVTDHITVGMRLATGGTGTGSNPGSENQTLGNYETRSSVGLDRAFIAYEPVRWFDAAVGRVGDPFFRPTTLVWADDVSLEGIIVHFHPRITKHLNAFLLAGAFPVLQIDPFPTNGSSNKWLYAYQSGFALTFDDIAALRFGAALYDYRNLEGIPNPTIYSTAYSATAAPYRQTGNTVFDINGLLNTQNGTQNWLWGLASKFHVLNLSAALDFNFIGPTHVIIDGDWVKNLGYDQAEIEQRTGLLDTRAVYGWVSLVQVGYPDMVRQFSWNFYGGFRNVQRDATVDAFTDQDFHLGGTDATGYFLGARFAFEKNTYLHARWFSAKQISGVERAGEFSVSSLPYAVNVFQLDVQSAF